MFSNGLCTLDAENKYDKSILTTFALNPAPKDKNFLAPLSSLSLKYPALNANEF